MTKLKDPEKKLKKLEQKVADLKQTVEMFIPTERLDAYKNADEIKNQYQAATDDHPVND